MSSDINLSSLDDIELTRDSNNVCNPSIASNEGFMSLNKTSSVHSGKIDSNASTKYTTTGFNRIRLNIPLNLDIKARERQLALKEKEIEEQARALQQRFGYIVPNGIDTFNKPTMRTPKVSNWPHSKFCPLTHHDIEKDIEPQHQPLVRIAFLLWKFVAIGLIMNIGIISTAAFHDNYYGSPQAAASALFTAIGIGALAIPLSFVSWYKALYKMCHRYNKSRWISFVVTFAIHGLMSFVMVLGAPWYPCAGVFFAIINFGTGHHFVGGMALFNTVVWTIIMALTGLIMRRVRYTFSSSGDIMEDAQNGIRRGFGEMLRSVIWGSDL